jgi:phenylalanyl-tRNA synthetase beta chain
VLAGAGLYEACTSSLIGPADLDRMGYPEDDPQRRALRLTNPLSVDESLLRTSLLPGLAAAAARNVARRNLTVRLFESGRCFSPSPDELLPREPLRLGLALHGPVPRQWHSPEREMDFFDLKGVLEALFEALRIEDVGYRAVEAQLFRPGRAAELTAGDAPLGIMGELGPEASERYGFTHRAALAELELGVLLGLARPPSPARELARFPAVLLDLAVSVPEEVTAAEVVETVRLAGGAVLDAVRIFDLYRGEQVGPGRKSLALFLSFQRPDRTLTQEEALSARDAIAAALEDRHGGQVRQ